MERKALMGGGEGMTVGIEAMQSDAKLWQTAASDLRDPKSTAESATLTPQETSFMSREMGLDQELDELRSSIADMIGQAAKYFNKISTDLTDAAEQYQADDDSARDEL